ncbi:nitroreductase family protein [Photobacterium sp. SDRW27]|uniref:nitroreductase family protein n=1 Tax=Photobacterium obscurum TaxID=2829490 RepID=UPI0022435F05|nr:nitroreductase family protein [Photobacterium obscurum]MCW8328252.1 nitroreductase family protein [Photobacterium obscurum]
MSKFKIKLMNAIRFVRLQMVLLCSKNRFLSRLFFLFEPSFDREYEYTLKGRYEALTSRYQNDYSNANLRRCVHRIEKGLFHKYRKDQFGKDLLTELYREVKSLDKFPFVDKNEVDWSINTLTEYKSFSYDQNKVQECIDILTDLKTNEFDIDKSRLEIEKQNPKFSVLSELYHARSSVRYFTEQKVDLSEVQAAVDIAKLAPTACNRQPFSLHFLDTREDIDFIGGLAPGTKGFLENIPALAVVVGHASSFRFTRDRHLVYTDSALFLGHFLPALKSIGLSSCVLNWVPDWNNDRSGVEYLGLDLSKTIICLVAIGHQDMECSSPVSTKKTSGVLLRYKESGETNEV